MESRAGTARSEPLVFLTGASGLLGAAAVEELRRQGFRLRLLRHRREVPAGDAEVFDGALDDRDSLARGFYGARFACHVAGSMSGDADELQRVNASGSRALFEAAKDAGVERVIFISTSAVYGPGALLDVDEDHPTDADTAYGRSKRDGETLGRAILGERLTVLRPVNIYSAERCPLLSAVASLLRDGAPLPAPRGDGPPLDLVHAEDAAQAIRLALDHRGRGGTFHIAGPDQPSYRSVIESLGRRVGRAPCWAPPDEAASSLAFLAEAATVQRTVSIERARAELGYAPRRAWSEFMESVPMF